MPQPDNIRKNIIAFLTLWRKNLEQKHGHKHSILHQPEVKVSKALDMIYNLSGISISYDVLDKYKNSDPTINSLVTLNRDTIKLNTDREDQVPETQPQLDTVPEPTEVQPEAEPLETEPVGEPAAPVAPAPQPQDTLPGSRSIVAGMAKRAQSRARK